MRARASELLPLAQRELGVKEVPAGSNTVKYNTAYYGREVRADGSLVTIEGNTGSVNDANVGQIRQRIRPAWQAAGGYRPQYEEDEEMDQTVFNKLADKWMENRAALKPGIQTEEGRAARA